MCLGMNPDILAAGERCASTSNRNFEGRQGAGGRTHLLSPTMAAAAAVTGHFTDVQGARMMGRHREGAPAGDGTGRRCSTAPTSTPTRSSRSSS